MPTYSETNAQSAQRIFYAFVVAAIVLAAGLAVMGTVLGARLHSEPAYFAGEGGRSVYTGYGWPWSWKTNAPRSVIEFSNDTREYPLYSEDGYAPAVFLWTTIMWFLAALTAEALLWVILSLGWHMARSQRRSSPSSSLPP